MQSHLRKVDRRARNFGDIKQSARAASIESRRGISVKPAIGLNVQIDFGFVDTVAPSPADISLPQILDFGNPELTGYMPGSAIAEKFQAMVELDLANTRIKDFYDVWLLSQNLEFQGEVLAEAIKTTFAKRQTSLPSNPPNALTARFANSDVKVNQWRAFLRKNRLDVEIDLSEIVQSISEFLWPVVNSLIENRNFSLR